MDPDLTDLYEDMTDREIAVELEISEKDVQNRREDSGFLRLDEFEQNQEVSNELSIDVELDKMEKRKLQGFMGEKITFLMRNRVVDFLSTHLRDFWILREKLHIINNDSNFQRYWASGKPQQGSIKIEGRNLKHHGSTNEELREYVKDKCVAAQKDIFSKFKDVRNPFIDFNFYAVKKTGVQKVEFSVKNYSSKSFESKEKMEVEIPVIEDFKIVMLEVKTTKQDAQSLFSENQRNARDLAKNSPYLDFFSLRIDEEFSEMDISSEFNLEVEKHS